MRKHGIMNTLYHVFFLGDYMKLKSKLVISFCIIMFVPILLAFLIIAAFFRVQWQVALHNIEVMPDVRGLFFDIIFAIVFIYFPPL